LIRDIYKVINIYNHFVITTSLVIQNFVLLIEIKTVIIHNCLAEILL